MRNALFMAMALICAIGLAYADTDAEQLELTLIVPSVCDISLSRSSVTFGTIVLNTPSVENTTVVSNIGSVVADLSIRGTNWGDGQGNSIPVGQTKFATTSGNYDSKTALSTTDQTLYEDLGVGSGVTVYLQVKVPQGTKAGTYSQTVTITGTC